LSRRIRNCNMVEGLHTGKQQHQAKMSAAGVKQALTAVFQLL